MAKTRPSCAAHTSVPSAANLSVLIGNRVLVYRDGPKSWVGPYRVIDTDHKHVHVDADGRIVSMSIDRCKLFHTDHDTKDTEHNHIDEDSGSNTTQIDTLSLNDEFWDINPNNVDPLVFHLVRTVHANDPRAQEPDFIEANRKEVEGLESRNIWKKVHVTTVPKDADIVGGRFVHTLKNFKSPEEMAKFRYIAQGPNKSFQFPSMSFNPIITPTA